jgi:hypothetical protein
MARPLPSVRDGNRHLAATLQKGFHPSRAGHARTMPVVTSYVVEAPPGQLSPPLASEDAAHDWAASNRRGAEYLVIVRSDDHEVARRRCAPRPT